eukprot:gene9176-10150_t
MSNIFHLPGLAQQFLQSELEEARPANISRQDNEKQGAPVQPSSTLVMSLASQEAIVYQTCDVVKEFIEDKNSLLKVILINGKHGAGKTTILNRVVNEVSFKHILEQDDITCFAVKSHTSIHSLYSFCSKIARNENLKQEFSILEELEGKKERKDLAVRTVLGRFKLICIDNVDADGFRVWSYLQSHFMTTDASVVIVATLSSPIESIAKNDYEIFHTHPLTETEALDLIKFKSQIDIAMSSNRKHLLSLGQGLPINICLLSNLLVSKGECCLAQHGNFNKEDGDRSVFDIINKGLDCQSKYLLQQICQLRKPIPVHDPTIFEKLIDFGLIESCLVKGYLFLSVAPGVQHYSGCLTQCHAHETHNLSRLSSAELWKDLLSPRLRELLLDCQNKGWVFVPESWNSVKDVSHADKYNINDLLNRKNEFNDDLKEYDVLLECLYHMVLENNYDEASAVIFLIDRYTFWNGTCKAALSVLSYIEEKSPQTPVPPQVVVRKARILKNDGNIQEAEKLLDKVINSKKNLNAYHYKTEDDWQHVKALCVSIKGDILRGLGLWKDAASTLLLSIVLTENLKRIEKKIIAGSKAHLSDTFRYMSMEDFAVITNEYNLTSGHPLREAIKQATESSQLCSYTPLFYLKNKRRAGDLSLKIAKQLPDHENKYQYLENAAHELREGLRCHDSISRLESKDQFYEFILAVQRLSLISKELKIGNNLSGTLLRLAMLLYEHHCLFPQQIKHTKRSKMLIDMTLSLLELPCIPLEDNLEMMDSYTPLVEIKPELNVRSLTAVEHGKIKQIESVIQDASGSNADDSGNNAVHKEEETDSMDDDVTIRNNATTLDEVSKEGFRNAETATEDEVAERLCFEKKKLEEASKEGFRNAETATEDEVAERLCFEKKRLEEASKEGFRNAETATEDEVAEKLCFESCSNFVREEERMATEMQMNLQQMSLFISEREDDTNMRIKDTANSIEDAEISTFSMNQMQSDLRINSKETRGNGDAALRSSISNLETDHATIEGCYATAEKESTKERCIRVQDTVHKLGHSAKTSIDWVNLQKFRTGNHDGVHVAMQWLYSPEAKSWSSTETLAYISRKLELGKKEGACRDAFYIEFLEQDDPLRRYVGKQYKLEKYKDRPRLKQQYMQDIICQTTSRFYAASFNKVLYQIPEGKNIGQVNFLPAVLIELLDVENEIERYYNVEPYMSGEFVKISNNFNWIIQGDVPGKDLLMALSHFSYCHSQGKEIVVDIQGWTSEEWEGLTFLTDPQIHTMDRLGFGTANRGKEGFDKFWKEQHPICNRICTMLQLSRPS